MNEHKENIILIAQLWKFVHKLESRIEKLESK